MIAKKQVECQIVIDKGNNIEKEKIDELMFRLERMANTSDNFRVHINNVGLLYQMIIGTNNNNISEKDFTHEICKIGEIANILDDKVECRINILEFHGEFNENKNISKSSEEEEIEESEPSEEEIKESDIAGLNKEICNDKKEL